MFELIPTVDIQRGRVVRLLGGDPDQATVYFDHPVEAARHWAGLGYRWLHVVDLDAAMGSGDNREVITQLTREVGVKVEVGGGIRDLDAARYWLERVARIVIGTVAITQPEVVEALLSEFGAERVVVSIDARDGLVAVKGWQETSTVAARELAKRVAEQGVTQVIYTDIARDGTLKGVNPEPISLMRQAFAHTLLAGGGVASDNDLELYESIGLDGAIVGKALYEGKISHPGAA